MKAQVRPHNGTPTLFLDDQPVFADYQWIGSLDPQWAAQDAAAIRAYRDANIHIYSTDALSYEWTGPAPDGARVFDFTPVGKRLQSAIDVDPQALFNLRIMFETKYCIDNWFNARYPAELEGLSDGVQISASFASKVWQDDVQQVLRAYIAYLREAGLYDRVIGFQICTGVCGEWIKAWSSMGLNNGDTSEPMVRAFRLWLRAKYGSDAVLQTAWANPEVTLETAGVPTDAEQDQPTHYLFRDPRREQKTIDFNACYAEVATDALLGFCRVVKEETHREKLTGAFFGYLMDLAWNDTFFTDGYGSAEASHVSTIQRSSHLGLAQALRSPDLDFLVSPYSYHFRGLGGDGLPMQPTESLRVHGKLYLFEEDTLMHNALDPAPRKRMHPVSRSIAIYQRNFAQMVTHGLGVTWLENGQFPEDPSIIDEAHRWQAHYQQIGTWALDLDRAPQSEVAVFLDDESYLYEANRNNIDLPLIAHQRHMSLNRFGAPHDLYLLNDLLEGGLPPYKLYIFLNVFHLDDRRRAALKQIVRRNGQTALWYYAPGYINTDAEQAISLDHMTDLTGFRFNLGRSYWSAMGHVTDFTHPITRGLPQDLFWGSTRPIAPIFHVDDPEATVLGEVVYGLGRCQPGLALKTVNAGTPAAWTSVYSATPTLPAAVLRGIARHAGVHLYSEDGDVLYATPDLLAVHTTAGGCRTFKLPHQVEVVYDLYGQRHLGNDTAQFEVQLPPASTALYYTGSAGPLGSLISDQLGKKRP